MKWFRHMANAADDEFIEWLEHNYGFEGVGRYWRIVEIIARSMEKNRNDPSTEHQWVKWQQMLRGKRAVLNSFLLAIESQGKMILKQNENVLKITCPNILKMRDEYSRKSGHSPDQLRIDFRPEAEVERKKDKNPPLTPSQEPNPVRERIPVPQLNGKAKEDLNIGIDFAAAAAACRELLHLRELSSLDKAILAGWLEHYDFKGFVIPTMAEAIQRFKSNHGGKLPGTLSYFSNKIKETAA